MRDSSLSACTQAVLCAEVGHLELAHDYAYEAALIDLRDLHHNTRDGLHMASLAGAWTALVAGFGGLRDDDGVLALDPHLPERDHPAAVPVCGGEAFASPSTPTTATWSTACRPATAATTAV